MIIFADEKLNIDKLVNESLHQGSNKANSIQLVAPIISNATIKVAFELPNATNTRQYIMKSIGNYEESYIWTIDIPYCVTQIPGRVKCQIVATVGSQTIASQSFDFVVMEGVDYNNANLEDDQYSEIINYINEAKMSMANKVDINYNEMTLIESPKTTYSAECYKAIYSYQAVAGNIVNTAGYFIYAYNEETGTGTYVEATGAVDNEKTYYTRVISGYERVILPDDYVEGVNYYKIAKQQSIFNDANGLYFYIIEDGETKIMRITSKGITIDGKKVMTEEDMTADKIKYNDENTSLGASNVQEAVNLLDKKVNGIDTSQVIQFVSLGLKSIGVDEWSAVQYLFIKVNVTTLDYGNSYYIYDSSKKEYTSIVLSAENYDSETSYYKREEFYYYDFTHRLLTNSVTQDLMLTPDDDTQALLDEENIKIYPFVEMGGTTGHAYGRIKISKIPSRTITFVNVTLYGTGIATEAEGLKASQIDFQPTDDINSISVQGAITEINSKFNDEIDDLQSGVETMQSALENVKQTKTVDAYIVENSATYGSLWLKDADGTIFNTADGSLNQYDNYYIQSEGEYKGNTYTWSGTNYVKVAGNLSLGGGSTQAYPGNEGSKNRKTIDNHTTQLQNLAQRMTSAESKNTTQDTSIAGLNTTVGTLGNTVSAIQKLLGSANLKTNNKTIKEAINELFSNAFIPTFQSGSNRATGSNSNMYHYFTVITIGEWRIIFGRVDALDANGNVRVSWDQAMFKSSKFHSNDGYTIVPGFTIQTRTDNRGMDEPTHIKDIYTDGFIFYNSNGYCTTGTYVAFGKKV